MLRIYSCVFWLSVSLLREMAAHPGILAWKIPWTEEPREYRPWGHKKSDTTECLNQTELNTVKGFSIVSKAEVDVSLEHRWIINTLKNTQYNLLLEKCTSKLQWNVISHWSEWPSSKDLQTINAGEDVEKRKHSCSVGENVNWYSCYREQNGDFF